MRENQATPDRWFWFGVAVTIILGAIIVGWVVPILMQRSIP